MTSRSWGLAAAGWALAGLALISTWVPARAADKPVEIKMVTLAPRGTTPHLLLQRMAENWSKASSGRVRLTVLPDYTQGGEAAMVDKMGIGGIDAALMTIVGLSKIDKAVTALAVMPMMFRSLEEVDYVGDKLQGELAARMLEKGYVVLFWADLGWVRYFSVEPMIRPDDLKGMRVFSWAGDVDQADILRDAGFKPVPLDPVNILSGLQTGMINAAPSTPFNANAGQFTLKTKHMLELNWAPLVGGAVVRKKTWDKLPVELQADFLKVAADIGRELKASGRKESDDAVRAMKEKQGLQVHAVPPDIEAEWRQAAEAAYPRIRGRLVPADMWDRVVNILKEYRAAKGESR